MQRVDEILEQAKRLSVEERRQLVRGLEALAAQANVDRPAQGGGLLYARSMAAAGIGRADVPDVSSDKYAHLGEAYASGHRR